MTVKENMRFNLAMLALVGLFTLSACGKKAASFNQDMTNYYGNYGQANGSVWFASALSLENKMTLSDTTCAYSASMGPFSDAGLTALTIISKNATVGCLEVGTYNCTVTKALGAKDLKSMTIACDGQAAIVLDQALIYHY